MSSESSSIPTPEPILQLGLAFWGSKTMLSAIELGVFTELAAKSMTASQLASRLSLHPRGARDFFDALVALGTLTRNGDVYANTPSTDLFLDRKKPSYVGGILEMANARLYGFWGSLTEIRRQPLRHLLRPAKAARIPQGHDRSEQGIGDGPCREDSLA
jgi:hypothetical protein